MKARRNRCVEHGRVFCPVRQTDVDVDTCYGCPRLEGLWEGRPGTVTEIRCQGPAAPRHTIGDKGSYMAFVAGHPGMTGPRPR